MPARRTEPTRSLLQGCVYTAADKTNIRARFDAIRAAMTKPAPNVKTIKRARTA